VQREKAYAASSCEIVPQLLFEAPGSGVAEVQIVHELLGAMAMIDVRGFSLKLGEAPRVQVEPYLFHL